MKKVLFLCTENSVRSQIAEAILNSKGKGKFIAFSAGSNPAKEINPYAKKIIQNLGEDVSNYTPKHIEKFLDQEFDFVITLCDKMRNECPIVSNNSVNVHWWLADPKSFDGNEEEIINQFKKIKSELINRINLLLNLPMDKLDKVSLRQKLSELI